MKKILLIALVLLSVFSSAQNNYNRVNSRYNYLGLAADAFNLPGVGTPALKTAQLPRAGAMVYDSTGGNRGVYVYTGAANGWIKLYDTLMTVVSPNFYTTDGTTSGARAVNLGGNLTFSGHNTRSITFDSVNTFTASRNGQTRISFNSGNTSIFNSTGLGALVMSSGNTILSASGGIDLFAPLTDIKGNLAVLGLRDSIYIKPVNGDLRIYPLNHNFSPALTVLTLDTTDNRVYRTPLSDIGGGGSGLEIGVSTITGGTSPNFLRNNAGVLGEYTVTGTGTTAVLSTTPTFTTSLISPKVIGGTSTTADLDFQTTSGVGTTGADMHFRVGNNGATEAITIQNNASVGINNTSPQTKLDVAGVVNSRTDGAGTPSNPTFQFQDVNWRWFRDDDNSVGPQYSLITTGSAGGVGTQRSFLWRDNSTGNRFGGFVGNVSGSSGTENNFFITNTINQSGTAGYNGLLLNITETATGSGAKNLFKAQIGGVDKFVIDNAGNIGIGVTSPTAALHLKAGTATANTAPLKFTSGTNLTAPEAGAMEWNGTNLFVTQTTGPTRKTLAYTTDGIPLSSLLPATGTNTIDNGSFMQRWNWDALADTYGIYLTSTSTTAASNGQVILGILSTGSNANAGQSTFAAAFANTHSGTTSTNYGLNVSAASGTTNIGLQASASGGTTNTAINVVQGNVVVNSGDVGIGTTPATQLHTTGTVRFANFGAGTATFDASGNVTSVSDSRLKYIQGNYRAGLKEIKNINPIIYKWRPESNMETDNTYAGFSAQNIKDALGSEATGVSKEGYLSVQDRAIMAAMINAIKELSAKVEYLENELKKKK